jgi:hypothetical protein
MEKRHREVKQKTESERVLETAVYHYGTRLGMTVVKFSPLGSSGWPDRIFMYRGQTMFIEFKRPGEKLRPLQIKRASELREQGFVCLKCDDREQGRRFDGQFKKRVDA